MSKKNKVKGFGANLISLDVKQERKNVTPAVKQGDYLNQLAKDKLNKTSQQPSAATTQDNNGSDLNYTGSAVTQNTDSDNDDSESSNPQPAPAFDPTQFQEMINNAVATAINPLQEQLRSQQETHQQEVENLNSQLSDRDRQLETAQNQLSDRDRQLETAQNETRQAQSKVEELNSSVESANETINRFNDLYKLSGSQIPKGVPGGKQIDAPNVNLYTNINGDSYTGVLAEFHQILDQLPKARKNTSKGRMYYTQDPRQLDAFVKENKAKVMIALENHGRKHGLFQGRSNRVVTQAATTSGDIPGGFLDVLSSLARLSHRKGFVHHQFIDTNIEFDKGLGDNVQVYRAGYNPRPTNPDDRLLSGGGTYSRISTDGDNIQTGVRNITLKEWGLGKTGASHPLELPSFVQAYSMIELMAIIERNLMYDYYAWEDLKIRSLWSPTTRVLYNNNYAVTTDPTQVVANSQGTMQRGFLTNVFGYLQDLEVPTLPDGCYGLVMPTSPSTQFKNELDKHWEAPTPQALQDFTNMMTLDSYGDAPQAIGYLGKYCDFHMFHTNAYGTGVAGTEGVQDVTDGVGTGTYRSSYAFGANTIGRGVGTAMEIRRDTNDDFGRLNRYIWRSEEGFDALDVDPTGYSDTDPVPQQLRVFELRTRDVAA